MLYFFSGIGGAIYASIWWAFSYWHFDWLFVPGILGGLTLLSCIIVLIMKEIVKNE